MTELAALVRSELWYTNRSMQERGTQFCPMARYIEYHAGPYGYGFSRRAMSLPLVTGNYVHFPLGLILQWVLDSRKQNGVQPDSVPDEVIRWAIEGGLEKYTEVINKRGVLKYAEGDEEATARIQYLIKEQVHLIEGMVWAWCLLRLPIVLRDYIIIAVEEEQEYVVECTCGLGNGIGSFEDHELRGCVGIGDQTKPDFLGERRSDGLYCYTEFKTAGIANKSLADSWERKQQLIKGILGAERRYGVEVSHVWVETLVKGKREREYPYGMEQPKIQRSPFCYAYYAPPNPPVTEGQWRPNYTYYTALGEKFKAEKKSGYRNTPIWTVDPAEGWPGLPQVDNGDGTSQPMSVVEYWAKVMFNEYPVHLERQIFAVGPIPKNEVQIPKAIRSMIAEERLWQDRLWRIYDFSQQSGKQWGDDEFHEFLETVVPRSWNCDPFADHPCPNQPICHPATDDWRRPVESELFVYRSPHHAAEVEQIRRRGLVPPGSELALEEGEQEEADEPGGSNE